METWTNSTKRSPPSYGCSCCHRPNRSQPIPPGRSRSARSSLIRPPPGTTHEPRGAGTFREVTRFESAGGEPVREISPRGLSAPSSNSPGRGVGPFEGALRTSNGRVPPIPTRFPTGLWKARRIVRHPKPPPRIAPERSSSRLPCARTSWAIHGRPASLPESPWRAVRPAPSAGGAS